MSPRKIYHKQIRTDKRCNPGFCKAEGWGYKVNKYVFAQTLKELIDTQEQEIELAEGGKGDYQLREAFQHISVSPSRWGRMTELYRKSALKKARTVTVEEGSNEISAISQSLQESENLLLQRLEWTGSHVMCCFIF